MADNMNVKGVLVGIYKDVKYGWLINSCELQNGNINHLRYLAYNAIELLRGLLVIILLILFISVLPLYLIFILIKEAIQK